MIKQFFIVCKDKRIPYCLNPHIMKNYFDTLQAPNSTNINSAYVSIVGPGGDQTSESSSGSLLNKYSFKILFKHGCIFFAFQFSSCNSTAFLVLLVFLLKLFFRKFPEGTWLLAASLPVMNTSLYVDQVQLLLCVPF